MKAFLLLMAFIVEGLLILLGIGFDLYTGHLGIRDAFYDSWITSHLHTKRNAVGTLTAVAFAYLSLMTLFIIVHIVYREKGEKIGIMSALFILGTLAYAFYIFIKGINYLVEFASVHL
ncbi:hypothetical protein K1Y25_02310 [Mammaliicoccus sciuri]|uniref:hypothetical protein n=1 Tax=Mammaliicoccus sciuri TaxID=1296 RepID=UPI001E4680C5|nr:hypothetical protein [Mammaliicoccus sciuri]MCD8808090.1 hypothetical protein [Mammaliicoccus sciuri]MCD8894341.1 hypothetical protein [Mammaliicoccus sciuri]MCD8912672.1 hypothetical protein [Mammaliicoccus sciuri]